MESLFTLITFAIIVFLVIRLEKMYSNKKSKGNGTGNEGTETNPTKEKIK